MSWTPTLQSKQMHYSMVSNYGSQAMLLNKHYSSAYKPIYTPAYGSYGPLHVSVDSQANNLAVTDASLLNGKQITAESLIRQLDEAKVFVSEEIASSQRNIRSHEIAVSGMARSVKSEIQAGIQAETQAEIRAPRMPLVPEAASRTASRTASGASASGVTASASRASAPEVVAPQATAPQAIANLNHESTGQLQAQLTTTKESAGGTMARATAYPAPTLTTKQLFAVTAQAQLEDFSKLQNEQQANSLKPTVRALPPAVDTQLTGNQKVATNLTQTSVTKVNGLEIVLNPNSAVSRVSSTGTEQAFLWPLPSKGRLTSSYGHRVLAITNNAFHNGIDIAIKSGTPILAVKDGIVEKSGWNGGYGYAVFLKHNDGSESRYAHMSRIIVEEGEWVNQGQWLGLVGNTGLSTGPHLHFELHLGGTPVDPSAHLKFGGERLASR